MKWTISSRGRNHILPTHSGAHTALSAMIWRVSYTGGKHFWVLSCPITYIYLQDSLELSPHSPIYLFTFMYRSINTRYAAFTHSFFMYFTLFSVCFLLKLIFFRFLFLSSHFSSPVFDYHYFVAFGFAFYCYKICEIIPKI